MFPCAEPAAKCCSCFRGEKCEDPGKHPRIKGWEEAATTDEGKIRAWWARWPEANIGIMTGAESGFVVLDVDPRHGGDEALRDIHVMMVSNYADAQDRAVAAGAVRGFGKNDLDKPLPVDLLRSYLG